MLPEMLVVRTKTFPQIYIKTQSMETMEREETIQISIDQDDKFGLKT